MNNIIKHISSYIVITIFILTSNGCYSLKGISISPEIKTFSVERFRNSDNRAPLDIHLIFTEALRSKIRNETRLTEQEVDPDLVYEGAVTIYEISAEAVSGEQSSAFNRLTIGVKVSQTDNKNEKNSWERSFSFYKDFASDQTIQDIEDEFIEDIFKQITEDIYNKSFTNW